jgi:hypothetical protein
LLKSIVEQWEKEHDEMMKRCEPEVGSPAPFPGPQGEDPDFKGNKKLQWTYIVLRILQALGFGKGA